MRFSPNGREGNRKQPASARHPANRVEDHMLAVDGHSLGRIHASARAQREPLEEPTFAHLPASQKEKLARQLGYESFDRLLQASKVVTLSDGSTWWLTADRNGVLTPWNLCALESPPTAQANETLASPG
jgi:hypothetical protein